MMVEGILLLTIYMALKFLYNWRNKGGSSEGLSKIITTYNIFNRNCKRISITRALITCNWQQGYYFKLMFYRKLPFLILMLHSLINNSE